MYPSTVIGVLIPREYPSLLTISLPSVSSLRRDVSALKQVTETDAFGADLELTSRCMRYSNRSCVRVEVAVLGAPSLISLMVSVAVKQH